MLHAAVGKDKLTSNHVIFRDGLRFLELTDTAHRHAYMQLTDTVAVCKASYTDIFQTDM